MRIEDVDVAGLSQRYAAARPQASDAADVAQLVAEHERLGKGYVSTTESSILTSLAGIRSWTRRQLLIRERESRRLLSWLSVHDRAAGRTVVELLLDPALSEDEASNLAEVLFDFAERYATEIGAMRRLRWTLLDSGAFEADARQQRLLGSAGYEHVRTWLQMYRPVLAEEDATGAARRPGVLIRRVEQHPDGLPVAADLQAVHQVLEESFADHFSSYRESFPEFVMRLREEPGHRWDHWWLATIETEEGLLSAGALVSSVIGPDASGREGSYVDYIGVHRRARGRGVAKALLRTVIADAAARGRDRVGLEVDADSPTGADGLYASLGWETTYRTQSWHRDLAVGPPAAGGTSA